MGESPEPIWLGKMRAEPEALWDMRSGGEGRGARLGRWGTTEKGSLCVDMLNARRKKGKEMRALGKDSGGGVKGEFGQWSRSQRTTGEKG